MKYAVVRESIVDNVIECNGLTVQPLEKVMKCLLVPCEGTPVAVGDTYSAGSFYRAGEVVMPNKTIDQEVSELSVKLESTESQLTDAQLALCEQYETNLVLQDELTNTQLALCESYEENLALQEEVTNTQLALCDVYEQLLAINAE